MYEVRYIIIIFYEEQRFERITPLYKSEKPLKIVGFSVDLSFDSDILYNELQSRICESTAIGS